MPRKLSNNDIIALATEDNIDILYQISQLDWTKMHSPSDAGIKQRKEFTILAEELKQKVYDTKMSKTTKRHL